MNHVERSYWSVWRAAHPEYRVRQSLLRRERRATSGRGDRTAEYARQRARRSAQRVVKDGESGMTATTSPLLDLARSIAARFRSPDRRVTCYRPVFEDATGEAALALVDGSDPTEAVRAYLKDERAWGYRTVAMTVEPSAVDPDYILCSHGYLRAGWCWDCLP